MNLLTQVKIRSRIVSKLCSFLLICFLCSLSFSIFANLPYYPIQFPRDEAAHHDNVPYPISNITEWWYYNGKLTTTTGRHFGYYLFFFNSYKYKFKYKLMLPLFFIQLTDIDNQKVYGTKMSFFNKKKFSVSTQELNLIYGKDLTLRKVNNTYLLNITIPSDKESKFGLSLQLTPTRDALLASKMGLIDMRNNTNSYYYSYTNMHTSGNVQLDDERLQVDPNQSLSWMDHQWGDFAITNDVRWMWASIQLKNGLAMDLAAMIDEKNKQITPVWANIIMPDNSRIYLTNPKDFEYRYHAIPNGQNYPLSYELTIPSIDLKLKLEAYTSGQDVNGIWEGISSAKGTYKGSPVEGEATTEYVGKAVNLD